MHFVLLKKRHWLLAELQSLQKIKVPFGLLAQQSEMTVYEEESY